MSPQPNPSLSVDCVVFGFDGAALKVLLVERDFVNPAANASMISSCPAA